MNKSTVIIQGSARHDGDSAKVTKFLVEKYGMHSIDLSQCNIAPFDYNNKNKNDDFLSIMKDIIYNNDQWIMLSPVYWYTISGRMKIFLDRITDILKWNKELGRQIRGKSLGLISVSNDPELQDYYQVPVELSAEYLGMQYIGHQHSVVNEGEITPQSILSLDLYATNFINA